MADHTQTLLNEVANTFPRARSYKTRANAERHANKVYAESHTTVWIYIAQRKHDGRWLCMVNYSEYSSINVLWFVDHNICIFDQRTLDMAIEVVG